MDAHTRRWSAPEAMRIDGEVNEWIGAAQMFAARIQQDPGRLTREQWQAVAEAWAALLAAAGRSTGPADDEWFLRDLWLRSWLLQNLGPREDVPLFDPESVLVRALDAMPMNPGEAAAPAARWSEMEHAQKPGFLPQVRELRKIRRLLNPVRPLAPLLADHPRWQEFRSWERVAPDLP
ncbi:hypothetical protein [Streptomyces sp. NPDC048277]|uniref:hypothetical protein n=1 Tax=Streptomyces sp. NPDC048277 TaxID=3155027 RepID=UPI0033E3FBB5